ncbi:unnamed protein product [Dracunculus medinensis]|uniref:NADH-ubiquinone oxidoreductase B12 subunit n=1 Tax=Dracunculus medinensis TaxID=318479 RepID=A0A0N4UI04_DRAME|nr:unnamed protein product [Dracunculus medinensis]
MPRASRIVRVSRYLRALPRFLWNEYPEQVVAASTFGVGGLVAFAYKISIYSDEKVTRPYYRGSYEVVRPDDPLALIWRKPELHYIFRLFEGFQTFQDYPAPYLSNRENATSASYKKDYGWRANI